MRQALIDALTAPSTTPTTAPASELDKLDTELMLGLLRGSLLAFVAWAVVPWHWRRQAVSMAIVLAIIGFSTGHKVIDVLINAFIGILVANIPQGGAPPGGPTGSQSVGQT